jgi:4-hydroxy-tetrahydrodipicolinate reductase
MMSEAREVCVVGALGRMGERVRAAVAEEPSLRLASALEASGHPRLGEVLDDGVVLSDDPKRAVKSARVVIDFSLPDVTLATLRAAAAAGTAYVAGTTGFSEAQREEISSLSERVPVMLAANFSVAVNVLGWLVGQAARRLGPDYDAELVEIHHAAKRDAPSGTALWLAEAIAKARGQTLEECAVLERAGEIGARPQGAIGIQSLRAGDCPGEHTVIFAGRGERLELVHRSSTRDHFARGAVRAAAWLCGREPGAYVFEQVLELGSENG